jgi:hypothetical protein
LRSSGSSAITATGFATAIVLPQSYAFFRELPVHDAGSLERPFHRASTASRTLSLASRPPMRLCALQRLRPAAAASARLTSPNLPAPAGFLTLLTPSSPPRALRPCFMPVALLGFTLQSFPLSSSRLTSR